MLTKERGKLRSYINEGLASFLQEDLQDGEDNLLWGAKALEDLEGLKPKLTLEEEKNFKEALTSLTVLPQQTPNAADSMLDMEGVRCKKAGKLLVFYRYNSSFDLVDIIRLLEKTSELEELLAGKRD